MNVSTEKGPGQVVLTVEVPAEDLERAKDKAYRKLVARTNIPGFRKGKAPRSLLERFIGPTALLQEAIDNLVPQAYQDALRSEGITPFADPELEITSADPLAFRATVPIEPTVILGDYQSIRVSVGEPGASEDDVNAVLERMRNEQATWKPIDRPIEFGDSVTLDMRGSVDGAEFTNQENVPYLVAEGNPVPVPGFAEQLIGLSAGESKSFDLSFGADAEPESVRGKAYHFDVTAREVKAKDLPALDDEFAKGLGQGVESVEDLRRRVRETLERHADSQRLEALRGQAVAKLLEQATFEYSPAIVHQEVHRIVEERAAVLAQQGISWERWLQIIDKRPDEVTAEFQEPAEQRLKSRLALDQLARDEELSISEEEIDLEIASFSELQGESAEQAQARREHDTTRAAMRRSVLRRRALERLMAIATEGKWSRLVAKSVAPADSADRSSEPLQPATGAADTEASQPSSEVTP